MVINKNILLISDNLQNDEIFLSSLIKEDNIVFYQKDIQDNITLFIDEIMKKKQQLNFNIENLAFVYHFEGYHNLPFFRNFEKCKNLDNNNCEYHYFTESFLEIIEFLKQNFYLKNIDLVTCDIKDKYFIQEVQDISNKFNISINYSINKTGNSVDWVLESNGVNIKNIYFNENINYWTGVLNNEINITDISGIDISSNTFGGKTYTLTKTINITDISGYNANSFLTLKEGDIFDGSGFSFDFSGNETGGLFSIDSNVNSLNTSPIIKNLGVLNGIIRDNGGFIVRQSQDYFRVENCNNTCNVTGYGSGGIVGSNAGIYGSCSITNCQNTGYISGYFSGGIVGYYAGIYGSFSITNCKNIGDISGNNAGGIVGPNAGASGSCLITNCYNVGDINEKGSGGITGSYAGFGGSCSIINCYNVGDINEEDSGGISGIYGGFSGGNLFITNCYNNGDIGGKNSGGISGKYAGNKGNCKITNCYNKGNVTGEGSGGISGSYAGYLGNLFITNCYNSGLVTGLNVGGIIGNYGGLIETNSPENICVISNSFTLSGYITGGIIISHFSFLTSNILQHQTYGPITNSRGALFPIIILLSGNYSGINTNYLNKWNDLSNSYIQLENSIIPVLSIQESDFTIYDEVISNNINSDSSFITKWYENQSGIQINDIDLNNKININEIPGINISLNTTGVTTYKLTQNINITDVSGYILDNFFTLKENEIFDGSGFSINFSGIETSGLFLIDPSVNSLENSPIIRNLGIINGYVKNSGGFIVRQSQKYFRVENCYNICNINGEDSGGIVGANVNNCVITNCYNKGDISGNNAGGIISSNVNNCVITNCYNTGNINGEDAGGVVSSNVDNCIITNCYNTGNINGEDAGGIVGVYAGLNGGCRITNCYNTGIINGKNSGGIIGSNGGNCIITNSYNNGNIKGINNGGISGNNTGIAEGINFIITNSFTSFGYITGSSVNVLQHQTYGPFNSEPGINNREALFSINILLIRNFIGINTDYLNNWNNLSNSFIQIENIIPVVPRLSIQDSTYTLSGENITINSNILESFMIGWYGNQLRETSNEIIKTSNNKEVKILPNNFTPGLTESYYYTKKSGIYNIGDISFNLNNNGSILYKGVTYNIGDSLTITSNGNDYELFVSPLWLSDSINTSNEINITDISGIDISLNRFGGKTYTLTKTINIADISGYNANSFLTLKEGDIFDGSGFSFDFSGNETGGLFSIDSNVNSLNTSPIIKNLGVLNGIIRDNGGFIVRESQEYFRVENCNNTCNVTGYGSGGIVGSKAGTNGSCSITNCQNNGSVNGDVAGGIVGSGAGNCVIRNCYNNGNIYGFWVGGIVGYLAGTTGNCLINNCYNNGNIDGIGVGGIAGTGIRNTITNCYNNGNINGNYNGGIVGIYAGSGASCSILDCENIGNVGGNKTGGIVGGYSGNMGSCSITNCKNTGNISGIETGGIVGSYPGNMGNCLLTNCKNTGNIDGILTGGIAGSYPGNAGNCTVNNCNNTGNLIGKEVSGIVSKNAGSQGGSCSINNCYNIGNIIGNNIQGYNLGCAGIAGIYAGSGGSCTIKNCYNTGNLIYPDSGGITSAAPGSNGGSCTITNCFNTGSISSNNSAGIVSTGAGSSIKDFLSNTFGNNGNCLITNCYNTGDISGIEAGGIAGSFTGIGGICIITNCYNKGIVNGEKSGGITGYNTGGFTGVTGSCIISNSFTSSGYITGSSSNVIQKETYGPFSSETSTNSSSALFDINDLYSGNLININTEYLNNWINLSNNFIRVKKRISGEPALSIQENSFTISGESITISNDISERFIISWYMNQLSPSGIEIITTKDNKEFKILPNYFMPGLTDSYYYTSTPGIYYFGSVKLILNNDGSVSYNDKIYNVGDSLTITFNGNDYIIYINSMAFSDRIIPKSYWKNDILLLLSFI